MDDARPKASKAQRRPNADRGRNRPKPVNLALQGGGSHGAFTWGVLDYLLEHDLVSFDGISGTSAGALNAVVLAAGLAAGGPPMARTCLDVFWRKVADAAHASPIKRHPINVLMGDWSLDNSPAYIWFDLMSRLSSPYDINPLDLNPLRDLLLETVDFEKLVRCTVTKLFLSATNVHTGRVKVFKTHEVTPDVVMASACLPHLFKAVEVDGVPYWDGGYAGNPSLFPFFDSCATQDLLLVQINPMMRAETPKTAREILNRVNEITFNQSLMKEFRAIEFVGRLLDEGKLDPAHYQRVLLHRIEAEEAMARLSASSKLNAEWAFLKELKAIGRKAAEDWSASCYPFVGQKATVDIRKLFA